MAFFVALESMFKGKFIAIPHKVKMIRAAHRRCMAVGEEGHVYVWGQGFKREPIQ